MHGLLRYVWVGQTTTQSSTFLQNLELDHSSCSRSSRERTNDLRKGVRKASVSLRYRCSMPNHQTILIVAGLYVIYFESGNKVWPTQHCLSLINVRVERGDEESVWCSTNTKKSYLAGCAPFFTRSAIALLEHVIRIVEQNYADVWILSHRKWLRMRDTYAYIEKSWVSVREIRNDVR